MDNTNESTLQKSVGVLTGTTYRPSRPLANPLVPIASPIAQPLQNILTQLQPTTSLPGVNASGSSGSAPKQLISISATESPAKVQGRTMSEVSVSFIRDGSDKNFAGVKIWFTGYQGNGNPQLMTSSSESPVSFLVETTGETVVITAQTFGPDGTTSDFASAKTTTVALDGIVSAPPAPSIAQSLIGTATGYQFSFNQVTLNSGDEDVISGYTVYRNTTGALDGSQAKINYFAQNPTLTSAIVVTDTVVPAGGVFYYYWVSCVNTAGLESILTPAQSGTVAGAIGSIPPTIASALIYASTTSSITWSWPSVQCVLRADGTVTSIGAGTEAVTGLNTNTAYNFYPVYDETQKILRFIGQSDANPPNATGATFNGSTGNVTTTTSYVTATSITLEAWFKISFNNGGTFLSHGTPQTGTQTAYISQIGIAAGSVIGEYMGASTGPFSLVSTTRYDDGNWHHVAYVINGGVGHTLYVDGIQVATASQTTAIKTTTSFMRLGVGDTAPFMNGTLAYCAYYATALNAVQVNNHFNALTLSGPTIYNSTTLSDSPAYQWYLNDTTGTTAVEQIASNTGTYTGGFTLNQSSPVLVVSGSPQIAWVSANYLALQAQNLRNIVPLSAGALIASTTVTGSGGGGGGGTGGGGGGNRGCFSPNTRLRTQRGDIRFDELTTGDLVLTARGTWKQVIEITIKAHKGLVIDMGNGELVTTGHLFKLDSDWIRADSFFSQTPQFMEAQVWNAEIDADLNDDGTGLDTEHSYTLSNGKVAHNVLS